MEMRWRKPVGCPGGGVVVLNMTLCRDSETCHSNVVSVHSVGSETDWMNRKSVIDVITFTFTFTLSGALGHSCRSEAGVVVCVFSLRLSWMLG
jgi:hypothetical protein